MKVPFFRPSIGEAEIAEVVEVLRSGWLTTGPRVKELERRFAEAVGARHALALSSCTAALHLALEAIGLQRGEGVLVPTMTFAATAEVVRYFDAVPLLVDCDPVTLHLDLEDAERVVAKAGRAVRAIMPVHVGGLMVDVDAVAAFAARHGLVVIEDAAHTLPAARGGRSVGTTADLTCFSFYANKTMTTGEGGMVVTDRAEWAERMAVMSLHGMSRDAWKRYTGGGSWYYEIVAPGFKYNMTDIAAAIGIHQLARAEEMRAEREAIARELRGALAGLHDLVELPPDPPDVVHSWHLFPIRLKLDRLRIDRAAFIDAMKERGIGASVHWMPLHMHPYYRDTYGYRPEDLPRAAAVYPRLVSLPIFQGMTREERAAVESTVAELLSAHAGSG